ncbi:MAG TPA: nuclear transport factor 2 family protein [Thermomicrobiales bacterium]|nr:nuclear transport factor 2 family protein [Thermomicrobiales bacterium]
MHERDIATDLRAWFEEWARLVRAHDFERARGLFHSDVIGFGTRMSVVSGLDHLERDQWRNVWGTIADFRFLFDDLHCGVSYDRLQSWAVVPWTSTGFLEDGAPFDRPGRATVIFTRDRAADPWRALHTHISLAPGTPQHSFGNPAPSPPLPALREGTGG